MIARALAALLAVAGAAPVVAQEFVSPAGYSGDAKPRPGVAVDPEAGAPRLTRLSDAAVQPLFAIDPGYGRAAAQVRVVGAFAIVEPHGARVTDAWASGFLPVTVRLADGRCFLLSARYVGGTLSDGRLQRGSCRRPADAVDGAMPVAPAPLRPLGMPWGFGAWVDDRVRRTTIGAPGAKAFAPLLHARMAALAVMAMNSPDAPLANLTLVGRVHGRLILVTVELAY